MIKIALPISALLLAPPPPPSSGPPPAPEVTVAEQDTFEQPDEGMADEAPEVEIPEEDGLDAMAPPEADESTEEPQEQPEDPEPLVPRERDEDVSLDFDPYGLESDGYRPNAGRGAQIAGATIVGAGMVLGVVGLVYLVRTNKARTRLDSAIDSGDPAARVTPITDIEENRRMSRIFGLASAGAIAVGTVVFVVGLKRAKQKRHIQALVPRPQIGSGTAGLSWEGRF
jgi:hypothetical protein